MTHRISSSSTVKASVRKSGKGRGRKRRGAPSAAQSEELIILLEEAAEVIHISAKILRFGLQSYHPLDSARTPNNVLLEQEIGDFEAVVERIKKTGLGVTGRGIGRARRHKHVRLQRWLPT